MMARFSEQLKTYIQLRSLNHAQVAQRAGVDRTLISHFVRGTRTPGSLELIEKLSAALMLSPEECKEFFRAAQIAHLGEDVYLRRQAVQAMLLNISLPEETAAAEPPSEPPDITLPQVCEGAAQIRALLKTLIDLESTQPNGEIRFLGQPEQEFLIYLLQCASSMASLNTQHIFCLDHNPRAGVANMANFGLILSSLFTAKHYKAFYFYGTLPAYHSYLSPFPTLLLTSTCAVQINADYTAAIVHTGPAYHLLDSVFQQARKNSRPLVHRIDMLEDYIDRQATFMHNIQAGKDDCFYVLIPDLGCTSFLTKDILQEHLMPQLSNREQLISAILKRSEDSLRGVLNYPMVQYISKPGILRFLDTGRFFECPDKFYTPLSPVHRARILKRCIEAAESADQYQLRLYDARALPFGHALAVTVNFNNAAFSIHSKRNFSDFIYLSVDEPSVSSALSDYFAGLLDNPAVSSKTDTLAWLKMTLAQFYLKNNVDID